MAAIMWCSAMAWRRKWHVMAAGMARKAKASALSPESSHYSREIINKETREGIVCGVRMAATPCVEGNKSENRLVRCRNREMWETKWMNDVRLGREVSGRYSLCESRRYARRRRATEIRKYKMRINERIPVVSFSRQISSMKIGLPRR